MRECVAFADGAHSGTQMLRPATIQAVLAERLRRPLAPALGVLPLRKTLGGSEDSNRRPQHSS